MTTHTPEHLEEKLRADLPASFVKVSCHSQLPPFIRSTNVYTLPRHAFPTVSASD